MFMDEINAIDRGMCLDGAFAKHARSSARPRTIVGSAGAQEYAEKNPAAGRRNAAAANDPLTGKLWWEQGPTWERSHREKKRRDALKLLLSKRIDNNSMS